MRTPVTLMLLATLAACGSDRPGIISAPSDTDAPAEMPGADTDAPTHGDTDPPATPGDTDAPVDTDPDPSDTDPVDTDPVDTQPPPVDADADGHALPLDCDDTDPTVHPGAPEILADGIDSDCDGAEMCFVDADGDGSGGPGTGLFPLPAGCASPGAATSPGDCDDADPLQGPARPWYVDADGDGWGLDGTARTTCFPLAGEVDRPGDCDDGSAAISPDAPETPGDAIDQDCDGFELCWPDADGDGLGADGPTVLTTDLACAFGHAPTPGDCDDADPALPAVFHRDADGDGYGDPAVQQRACVAPLGYVADDRDCHDGDPSLPTTWYADLDGDGRGDPASARLDCFPAGHVLDDTDCDDTDPLLPTTWYRDLDGDGHGRPEASEEACVPSPGFVALDDDCDDFDDTRAPGLPELCNDHVDQDCDPSPEPCAWAGDVAGDDAEIEILGAIAGDGFGDAMLGGLDLTTDGVPDLLVSAPFSNLSSDVHLYDGASLTSTPWYALDQHTRFNGPAGDHMGRGMAAVAGPMGAEVFLGLPDNRNPDLQPAGLVMRFASPFTPGTRSAMSQDGLVEGYTSGRHYGASLAAWSAWGTMPSTLFVVEPADDGHSRVRWTEPAGWLLSPLETTEQWVGSTHVGGLLTTAAGGPVLAVGAGGDLVDDLGLDWAAAWVRGDGQLEVSVFSDLPSSSLLSLTNPPAAMIPARVRFPADVLDDDEVPTVRLTRDLTGDTSDDLVVGLPCSRFGCAGGGEVRVLPGPLPTGTAVTASTIPGAFRLSDDETNARLGLGVEHAGDVDGDGFGDLIVAAPSHDDGDGYVWLIYGPLPAGDYTTDDIGDTLRGVRFVSPAGAEVGFGQSIAPLGDLDGDGFDDLAIGCVRCSGHLGSVRAGRVTLWFGRGE